MRDIRSEILDVLKPIQGNDLSKAAYIMGLPVKSMRTVINRMGRDNPKIDTITRYAQALDVDIIYSARLILPDGSERTVTGIIETKPNPNQNPGDIDHND